MAFFTSLPGSLIHPLAMSIIVLLWILAAFLGLQVRNQRLSSTAEALGLVSRVRSDKKRHHKLAAGLLFLTTFFCFLGMYNTYSRAGRLFPGPHLYGGLGLILALSANAALVPWFKDITKIRLLHAANGCIVLLLVANQVKSGRPILVSVWNTVH